LPGYFDERFCAEIDYVAVNETNKIVIWGSCKRNGHTLSLENLQNHLIALYVGRSGDPSQVPYYSYTHTFAFFAPEISSGKAQAIEKKFSALGSDWYVKSEDIISLVKKVFQKDLTIIPPDFHFKLSPKPLIVSMSSMISIYDN
jgi:hypothetical protein